MGRTRCWHRPPRVGGALGLAASLVCAAGARAWEPAYRLVERGAVPRAGLSAEGRAVLRALGRAAVHAQSDHFWVHAGSRGACDRCAREAEWAWGEIGRRLILAEEGPRRRAHVFVIADRSGWERLCARREWRDDARAASWGEEIYLGPAALGLEGREALAHEIAHVRLRQAYENRLPLWLEEGLAGALGWEVARDYERLRGRQIERRDALEPAARLSWEELERAQEYPQGPRARAFRFQAEALVRGLEEMLGPEGLARWVRQVGTGARAWRTVLAEEFGWTAEDFQKLEQLAERAGGPS